MTDAATTVSPFARNFLAIAGLVFAGTGMTFVLAPTLVPVLAASAAPTPHDVNDVRAIYGAMELGIGVFLGITSLRPRLYEAGLIAALVIGGLAGLSRFVGFAIVPGTPVAHLGYGALDAVGAGLAWLGLRRVSR